MKAIKYLLPLTLVMSLVLLAQSAEKKWFPIEPIKIEQTSHPDANTSKPQPATKMIQNLTVIKNLLDHVNKDVQPAKNIQTWYTFEPSDND